jgi:hypothetical protein
MTILLDENFPLQLYRRLVEDGKSAEHILFGQRGIPDEQIIQRLRTEKLLFLTQNEDFANVPPDCEASIIWSHVSQSLPIRKRVEIWMAAINQFFAGEWTTKLFEVYDDGQLRPVEIRK